MKLLIILLVAIILWAGSLLGQSEINYNSLTQKKIKKISSTHLSKRVGPLAPLQGGENIATAFVLTGPLPITSNGTTDGYLDDYNEICPYDPGTYAPDVVYQYTPPSNVTVDIDLCGSSYDTKVFVYENSYTPGSPFACNDDYYEGPPCGAFVSKISSAQLVGKNTYYIVIDGYSDSDFGDYILTISESTPLITLSNPTSCGIALSIPDDGCFSDYLEVPVQVSGAPGTQLGTDVLFYSVSIIINHTYDGDLDISLVSPNGISIKLSSFNGSIGANYGDPTNCPVGVTEFTMCAATFIGDGVAPFIGSYIPDGDLSGFNDGSNPNGIWKLKICDGAASDVGTVEYISIVLVAPIPYTQNFDAVTVPAIPNCMTVTDDNADGYQWLTSSSYPRTAPNSMRIDYNSVLAMDDWFFTPPLTLAVGDYQVSFWYRSSVYDIEKMEVKWGTAPNAAGMTNGQIFNNNNIKTDAFIEGTGNLTVTTEGDYYVGWHGYSHADMWFLIVDDISINSLLTWTGNISAEWNDPGNWTGEIVPDLNAVVIIPSNPTGSKFPLIASGIIAECSDITIELPGTLTIQNGGTLYIKNH